MIQIKINGDKIITGLMEHDLIYLNDMLIDWDLANLGNNQFHIIKNNKSYKAEILLADWDLKTITVKINNSIFSIEMKDKQDMLLEKLGFNAVSKNIVSEIKAPMPGMIMKILVSEGQKVNAGDPLIILEAMKMENIIKAPIDAIVKLIAVVEGKSVEKNKVLIQF